MEKNLHVKFMDLGLIDYAEAWEYQKQVFDKTLEAKQKNLTTENHLLFCEHPHVFTLGKSGNRQNLLVDDRWLEDKDIPCYQTDRGGDITYHGPGQLVGYPIFDVDNFNISVKEFVFDIETVLIRTIKHFGLHGERLERATGVWIDAGIKGKERKIAAIGMRIHNKVSMHGFALNVNTNLDYFNYINPCGFQDKGVTSLQKELNHKIDMVKVKQLLIKEFEIIFEAEITAKTER
ncbi:Octanoate-[acyl-carrier-protein]-protein-N-octanoyltransferase [hydrothermal vent metagenome]|uniref:lipoyl(octanoyl) transferase n=1 Tax=hydrothermal vent metagenome TaxID=652676 RepID=A0A3B0VDA6_9ZZZZ